MVPHALLRRSRGGPRVDVEGAARHGAGSEGLGELAIAPAGDRRCHRGTREVDQPGQLDKLLRAGRGDTDHRDARRCARAQPVAEALRFEHALAEAAGAEHDGVGARRERAQRRGQIEVGEDFIPAQRPALSRLGAMRRRAVPGEHHDEQLVALHAPGHRLERAHDALPRERSAQPLEREVRRAEPCPEIGLDEIERARGARRRQPGRPGLIPGEQDRANHARREIDARASGDGANSSGARRHDLGPPAAAWLRA
jgi:hypothetical protein